MIKTQTVFFVYSYKEKKGNYVSTCPRCKGKGRPLPPQGICTSCGAFNEPEDSTCIACGRALPKAPGMTFQAKSFSTTTESPLHNNESFSQQDKLANTVGRNF